MPNSSEEQAFGLNIPAATEAPILGPSAQQDAGLEEALKQVAVVASGCWLVHLEHGPVAGVVVGASEQSPSTAVRIGGNGRTCASSSSFHTRSSARDSIAIASTLALARPHSPQAGTLGTSRWREMSTRASHLAFPFPASSLRCACACTCARDTKDSDGTRLSLPA
jgi:hypothetical protein